jgi:alpha-L-fucosidase
MIMNKRFKKLAVAVLLVFTNGLITANAQHKEYYPDPDTAIQRRLEEWKDLKFGLLMHWGTYSQWGIVESWSICPEDLSWATGARKKGVADNYVDYVKAYENLQTTFNPVKFNPGKWAAAAKEAGMKYMVFTTKHHDGFCMFDSKYTGYKITDKATPFAANPRSNITKEVFNAFRKENMWIGAYFSKPDWHTDYYWWKQFPQSDRNPSYSVQKYPEQWKKFTDFTHNQINELVSDYGKVDILWLDGGWVRKKTDEEVKSEMMEVYEGSRWTRNPQSQDIQMPELVKKVRAKQPKIIVVDRAVPGEQQNYLTPEQHIPETGLPYPWETCMTMANSWSYVPNDQYKPTNELIEKLVDIVSKGGGPSPEGEFDPVAYDRLKEIGVWMKLNGQAIYGTRMYKLFGEGENIRFTQSKDGKILNVFLFNYPQGNVHINNVSFNAKTTVKLIGSNQKLKWKAGSEGVDITLPASLKSVTDHVWVLQVQL